MQWTGLNELREKFLEYFESKQHLLVQQYLITVHKEKNDFLISH